jgi:hypothetical protein
VARMPSNQSTDGKTGGNQTCRQQPKLTQRNQSIKQANSV